MEYPVSTHPYTVRNLNLPKVWLARTGATPPSVPQTYTATLEEVLQPAADVRLFRLTLDGYHEIMPFQAGQFVQMLSLVPDPKRPGAQKKVLRAYSIASPPEEKRFLEFCVKLVPQGHFTPVLWTMHLGDKIDLRGPYGRFVVKDSSAEDLLFLAAGTGVAPFWSMIPHLLKSGLRKRIVLIFGARHEEDLVYQRQFEQLAAEHPNFTPIFTLSRPREPQKWLGRTGYVQHLIAEHLPDPAQCSAYLCGLSDMITQSVAELRRLGFAPAKIHYERYD